MLFEFLASTRAPVVIAHSWNNQTGLEAGAGTVTGIHFWLSVFNKHTLNLSFFLSNQRQCQSLISGFAVKRRSQAVNSVSGATDALKTQ